MSHTHTHDRLKAHTLNIKAFFELRDGKLILAYFKLIRKFHNYCTIAMKFEKGTCPPQVNCHKAHCSTTVYTVLLTQPESGMGRFLYLDQKKTKKLRYTVPIFVCQF